jgi:vacuole membrane protein 1
MKYECKKINLFTNPLYTLSQCRDNLLYLAEKYKQNIKEKICFITGFAVTTLTISVVLNNYIIIECFYWFVLGILSTVGFGTGLHTGTLFLIPDIINTFNNTNPGYNIKIIVFFKSLKNVICWGLGTAFGELPPFYLAKFSKEKYEGMIPLEYKQSYNKYSSIFKKYSFFFLILISSWPNMTFDFVGMLCGINGMSLYQFIIPTIIGKTFVKAPVQSFAVIYFYSELSGYMNTENMYILYCFKITIFVVMVIFITNIIETLAELKR